MPAKGRKVISPTAALYPDRSWFETRSFAALLTMRRRSILILRRREAPSRRMEATGFEESAQ
jgi:hypothetical protein